MANDYGITIGKCAKGYAIQTDGHFVLEPDGFISWVRPTIAEAEELAARFRNTVADRLFLACFTQTDAMQFCCESEHKRRQEAAAMLSAAEVD